MKNLKSLWLVRIREQVSGFHLTPSVQKFYHWSLNQVLLKVIGTISIFSKFLKIRTRSNALRNNEISVISYFHSFIEKNGWKDSVTGDTSQTLVMSHYIHSLKASRGENKREAFIETCYEKNEKKINVKNVFRTRQTKNLEKVGFVPFSFDGPYLSDP